jgi:chromosome segregation ATPase
MEKSKAEQEAARQLEDLKRKAQEDIQAAQEQHQTKLCELEAQLSSQVHTNNALENESSWLKEQTELARRELEAAHTAHIKERDRQHRDEINALEAQISQMQEELSSEAEKAASLQQELENRGQTIAELTRNHNNSMQLVSNLQSEFKKSNTDRDTLASGLAEAQDSNKTLSDELISKSEEAETQNKRISELETIAGRAQQRCVKLEKALAEARLREEGISALLAGAGRSSGLPSAPSIPAQRTTLAAPVRDPTKTQAFETQLSYDGYGVQQTGVPLLPEQSFISDDDDDYYEVMKLPQ